MQLLFIFLFINLINMNSDGFGTEDIELVNYNSNIWIVKQKISQSSEPISHRALPIALNIGLRPGVIFLMHLFQMISGYMGIYLRCGDVGVPEHDLHRPQIRSPLKQMGRK